MHWLRESQTLGVEILTFRIQEKGELTRTDGWDADTTVFGNGYLLGNVFVSDRWCGFQCLKSVRSYSLQCPAKHQTPKTTVLRCSEFLI
jgi:hypothetical protein